MTSNENPVQIVVAYDFSESARIALIRAVALAEDEPRHMLHVLAALDDKNGLGIAHTHKTDYNSAVEVQELLTRDVEALMREAAPRREVQFFVHARIGAPAAEILRLAEEVGAHLIVIGSHGRTGVKRMLMGSVSEKVVREARCPVLVARAREYQDMEMPAEQPAAPDQAYVPPHRYTYFNQLMSRQKASWPWY